MQTISANDYHDLVRVSDPQLSPDGERVAFVRTTPRDAEESEATIHIASLGGEGSRRFTLTAGIDSEPRWSPSGDHLSFVSTRGDDDRPQLWVAPADGGEARRITEGVGGVSNIAWRPDGEGIAFVQSSTGEDREEGRDIEQRDPDYEPETPDPRVIDRLIYRAGARYFDGGHSHVYVADVDGGVTRLTDGEYDYVTPEWGDSETLYYAAKRTDDPDDNAVHDVIAYDVESGTEEVLTETTGWAVGLAATADGRVAYHYTPDGGSTLRQTDLRVFDRGTETETTLTETLDRTVEGTPKWDPHGEYLYFLAPDEGDVSLRRVREDGEVETVARDGHIDGFDPGRDAVAMTKSEWDHPGDVFVSTPAGAETNRLTRVNSEYLTDRAVPQPEEVWFESDEGTEVQGWVLTPPDMAEGERYPLVVEIHGGPHAMWSTSGTMWHEFQTLAARGYVVFWCNPRGSTGYGEEHMGAIERDWGAVTARDVLAGTDAVCEREYVDEGQQFLTGGSFGGFMTGWLVGHTERFSGAVAQRGVYDLPSFYGSTDAFKLVEWDFGTEPWDDPEFLWAQSPVASAGEVETPTLVIHADEDFRVPVNNGEMFYLFLKKNGVETRLVRYPREGHELSRSGEPGHVVDRIERLARWFDGYSEHHDAPKALERGEDGLSGTGKGN
ncbi:S9 family peptidase [Halalkalicoccus jeotgali]|uniref:Peptidase S9 prolyl oligopeptidase active site domain protein n=1 Tax=Halalkalicoccus jeotgali (strain DSM 18796 / CECT 7217 / JCM 14584 / KCTC 4019 / B3) TaxID=795797 RepID=D8J3W6_HALJB|nr:S9 family peptidase [Halalkalicoccus jeotgali]ADJ13457.1 peptidase S9 prolyl oligopeptidase active site domain protein [Halalkalicoccus jeotgali B3]ELY33068.1 peptidase S9 prolyl oligopeptidase active site domain-containing protein [Halalkalicoccus jeotgali B3]